MKKSVIPILIIPFLFLSAQNKIQKSSFDEDVQHAYTNAMKGVYFALENIPESKSSLNSDLIEGDDLLAEIKLSKEFNGIKIEAKGFYKTYTVEVVVYRSYESLEADGYR